MAKIKEKSFVELEYTGRVKDTNDVFDTTNEKVAKESDIHNKAYKYGPSIVCIGQEQLIKALDEELINKEIPGKYTIEVQPEKGFGKKMLR